MSIRSCNRPLKRRSAISAVPCVDRGIGVLTLADILEGCAEGAVEEAEQAGVLRRHRVDLEGINRQCGTIAITKSPVGI